MNRGWWLALLAGSLVAWLQLDGVPAVARVWTAALLVPLPALMIVQARLLHAVDDLPRSQAYISSIVSLWVLAALTFGVARLSGMRAGDLGLDAASPMPALVVVPAVAALTLAGIGLLFLFRAAGVRELRVVRQLMPQTRRERMLFVGVALSAGICEEFIFRGFLLYVLLQTSGVTALAVGLSSGAFAVVHAYQGVAGVARAALLGAMLAVPVLFGVSLVTAMAAHALIDLLSGLWLARYLLR